MIIVFELILLRIKKNDFLWSVKIFPYSEKEHSTSVNAIGAYLSIVSSFGIEF